MRGLVVGEECVPLFVVFVSADLYQEVVEVRLYLLDGDDGRFARGDEIVLSLGDGEQQHDYCCADAVSLHFIIRDLMTTIVLIFQVNKIVYDALEANL
jgi:hypothetical protein